MANWFRFREVGFGMTPNSLMGWLLTVVLIGGIIFMGRYFRQSYGSLPMRFYVFSVLAIVVYTAIAYATASRNP